jgi:hypothetical protein
LAVGRDHFDRRVDATCSTALSRGPYSGREGLFLWRDFEDAFLGRQRVKLLPFIRPHQARSSRSLDVRGEIESCHGPTHRQRNLIYTLGMKLVGDFKIERDQQLCLRRTAASRVASDTP